MDLPRVLIISTSKSTSSIDIAKNIAKDMGSEYVAFSDNIHYYVWTIDNKYYSAKVFLCVSDAAPTDISDCGVEAIVLHHDPKEDIKRLDDYLPLVNELCVTDVFLLACQPFEDSVMREKVTEWSQTHKFEIVEMEPPNSSDVMDEETEDNVYGIERIVEALHTHVWPNWIRKADSPFSRSESSSDVDTVEDQLESMRLNPETRGNSDQSLMESMLGGIMGEENTDFGELFARLMDMKEHASSLSSNHRRAAAEELTTAFWKAMGGDPCEIEDLDQ